MRYAPCFMTDNASQGFAYLPPAEASLGAAFARARLIAWGCVIALTALGWLALGLMVKGNGGTFAALAALCRSAAAPLDVAAVALTASMWVAMVLAMMLPSAAPMILTYAEIADTAARKNEAVVSPLVLAAGYTVVWLGFAALATATQLLFAHASPFDGGFVAVSGPVSGAIFIAAGLYQFSALKHACLSQCQRPFPFFFVNWTTTVRGVFRLGLSQGLYCVGCCWAMMLVMFAAGVMNVVWMAGLGIVMAAEKIGTGKRLSYAVGAALILGGLGVALAGVAALGRAV
jgi:predicted metal-binding membrane protein